MLYTSTRESKVRVTAAQAIAQGISREGGLFVPESIPKFTPGELDVLARLDYIGRAEHILAKFLTEDGGSTSSGWKREQVSQCARAAYESGFTSPAVAPVRPLPSQGGALSVLELFHGPTCAFKDLALQLLPYLLTASAAKTQQGKEIVILVATSGDTGKAALEGFRDVPGTRIMVFYPGDGVSAVQKLQMVTQEGGNVLVAGVSGNFDDAQSGIKEIFTDAALRETMAKTGRVFSSANSINWGRLVPQIVYYVSAYCDLRNQKRLWPGEAVHFAVPTGNFGNILAGYFAKQMGLPIDKLICASNRNRILADFFATGRYDRNRPFFTTLSPSMDILISSNLERLLWLATGGDCEKIAGWMKQLAATGTYEIPPELLAELNETFIGGACNDTQTKNTIHQYYTRCGYLADTHTAVALRVLEDYRNTTGDTAPAVVVSTASPYKFAASVLGAITGNEPEGGDEFSAVVALEALTGVPCPTPLKRLRDKAVRFTDNCSPWKMKEYVLEQLAGTQLSAV
ncbi:MAG: threonine synthase [Oscillospiraceae bacterium]|jgi:threonine synthase|nr:threonine synthase [Oscillospiraceae bacterium]